MVNDSRFDSHSLEKTLKTDPMRYMTQSREGTEKSKLHPFILTVCLLYILRNTVYTPGGSAFSGPSLAVVCVRTSALEASASLRLSARLHSDTSVLARMTSALTRP